MTNVSNVPGYWCPRNHAAAQVAFEVITSMVKSGVTEDLGGWYGRRNEAMAQAKSGESVKDEL